MYVLILFAATAKRKMDDALELISDAGVPWSRFRPGLTSKRSKFGHSLCTLRKYVHRQLHALPNTDTPYGTLVERCSIKDTNGEFCFQYISPPAMLYYACRKSSAYADMVLSGADSSSPGRLRFAFYMNETKPGNERHPDRCKSTQTM